MAELTIWAIGGWVGATFGFLGLAAFFAGVAAAASDMVIM
jgi:hypothetical protein